MKIEAILILTLINPNGKTVLRRKLKSRSYLRAFIKCLYGNFCALGSSAPDTGNTSRALAINAYFQVTALPGTTTKGFRVGTGTTPVALSDYALQTPIAHGVGAGQLDHGASLVESYTETPSTYYFYARRSFVNSSGGTIVVNEVGLYGWEPVGNFYYCIIRDIVAAITIVAGQTLTTEYQIKISL